jgi:hypothetical protein
VLCSLVFCGFALSRFWIWIIELNFFPFFSLKKKFSPFSLSLFFFFSFPFCFFLLSFPSCLLSCCCLLALCYLKLPCRLILLPLHVTLSLPCTLLCCLIALVALSPWLSRRPCCFVVVSLPSLLHHPCHLVTSSPHYPHHCHDASLFRCYLVAPPCWVKVPSNPPICCFVASHLIA